MPDLDKLPSDFNTDSLNNIIGSFGLDDVQEYLEDADDASNLYIYTFLTCIIVAILYSVLIYYFTGLIVWVSIISTGVGLLLLSLWLQSYHDSKYGAGTKGAQADEANKNENKNNNGKYLQAFVYFLYTVTVAYFIALCCLFKDIAVSVGVLKTSAIVVVRNFRILLMPFFSALILVIWCSAWVANFSFLLSSGEITQPNSGS